MGKRNLFIAGLLCLPVFFFLNHSVTMIEVQRGKVRYTVAATQKPLEEVIVKKETLVIAPVTTAQKPIDKVTVKQETLVIAPVTTAQKPIDKVAVKQETLVIAPVTTAQKPIDKVAVKQETLVIAPVTTAQKPIDKVTVKQEPSVNVSVKFPLKTQTFDISRSKHKVWGNTEMSKYILGKRYEEFKKKTTTDKLVQEVQPQKLKFIINNETLCRSSDKLEFLIAIYTAPKHFEDRDAIRKSWGRPNLLAGHTSRTVFLLGAVVDPKLQEKILNESKIYGDIAQANYIDSYHNLSLKGISQLQWIKEHCSNAQYLVKADDDLYVDVFQVVKAIQVLSPVARFIIGDPFPRSTIIRSGYPKWNVKKHLFPADSYYPYYYQGWIYILPNAVFSDFYEAAMITPVFHIDDVYMTGLLAGQLSHLDFLSFHGKALEGTFLPTNHKLATECGPSCKISLFCEHLTRLTRDDKNLIAKGKLEIVAGELGCERLLREKMERTKKAEEEKRIRKEKAVVEKDAEDRKAAEVKKAKQKKEEEEKIARQKREKESAITHSSITEGATHATSSNTAQQN